MIKANELRIGNWASPFEQVAANVDCFQIDAADILSIASGRGVAFPIPISTEILISAGFEKGEYEGREQWLSPYFERVQPYHKCKIGLMAHPILGYTYEDAVVNIQVRSLHQLQNMFYVFTGEELEIKCLASPLKSIT